MIIWRDKNIILLLEGSLKKYSDGYDKMFSLVAKMKSVQVIISLVACHGWKLWQLDVRMHFLIGKLTKTSTWNSHCVHFKVIWSMYAC